MLMKFIDLTNQTFGKLTVISRLPNTALGRSVWLCACSCGKQKTIVGQSLRTGATKSCGCEKAISAKKRFTKHGLTYSRVNRIWRAMLSRCRNPNVACYARYGGAGVSVCERWLSFDNFFADMGHPPSESHSIDRIDNSLGYSLENCRWATPQEQADNSSKPKLLTFNGETHNISNWAKRLGIDPSTLIERLQTWPIEEALSCGKSHKTRRSPITR